MQPLTNYENRIFDSGVSVVLSVVIEINFDLPESFLEKLMVAELAKIVSAFYGSHLLLSLLVRALPNDMNSVSSGIISLYTLVSLI
jgi:hypothetical protein